ncbi:MAG: 30S ribosomal protein S15 [Candidatus Pacearchaeota archaeon]
MVEAEEKKIEQERSEEKKASKPEWVKLKPAELEKLVIDLYKKGNSPAKIGLILRDEHGVPRAKTFGKRITEILKNAKVPLRDEREIINKKIENLKAHIEKNKHDIPAKKALVKEMWALKKASE